MKQNKQKGLQISRLISAAKSIMNDNSLSWEIQDIASSIIATASNLTGMDTYQASFIPDTYRIMRVNLYSLDEQEEVCDIVVGLKYVLPNNEIRYIAVIGCAGEFSLEELGIFKDALCKYIGNKIPVEIITEDDDFAFHFASFTSKASDIISSQSELPPELGFKRKVVHSDLNDEPCLTKPTVETMQKYRNAIAAAYEKKSRR